MTEEEKLAEARRKRNERARANYSKQKEKRAAYYIANRDKLRANGAKYYAANREKKIEQQRAYNAANKDKEAARALKRLYGLTPGQFETMLSAQSAACAICRTAEPGGQGRFHVDHCHTTGKVRGLLCNRCNVGLGYFRDNSAALLSAASYLNSHRN